MKIINTMGLILFTITIITMCIILIEKQGINITFKFEMDNNTLEAIKLINNSYYNQEYKIPKENNQTNLAFNQFTINITLKQWE